MENHAKFLKNIPAIFILDIMVETTIVESFQNNFIRNDYFKHSRFSKNRKERNIQLYIKHDLNVDVYFPDPDAYQAIVLFIGKFKKTRIEICDKLDIKRTTAYDILYKMIINGQAVWNFKEMKIKKRGRKRVEFELTPEFLKSKFYRKLKRLSKL